MLDHITSALACPHCGSTLAIRGRVLVCASGHSFDIAREGYVNLLSGGASASTADTAAMVAARRAVLDADHFAPIADAVVAAALASDSDDRPGVVLDAGAGTGYVLGAVLDALPERVGVAMDVSRHAARIAARAHERAGAVVADVWRRLPLQDDSVALVLNVFAPRNAEEFSRVLSPGGVLMVVTPRDDHLAGLVEPLELLTVDPRKHERLSAKLSAHFELVEETVVTYGLELSHADAIAVAEMGPSAAHISADELALRARELAEPISVAVSVTVGTYSASGGIRTNR